METATQTTLREQMRKCPLKLARKKANVSQAELAVAMDVSSGTVSRWETCGFHMGIEHREKAAAFLGDSELVDAMDEWYSLFRR